MAMITLMLKWGIGCKDKDVPRNLKLAKRSETGSANLS